MVFCTLASMTRPGLKPTPVIGCGAGAAAVSFRKLPGLTFTPLSASEKTRAAATLAVFVKFIVKPSAFIDTHDARFCTARVCVERQERGVRELTALGVARYLSCPASSSRTPTDRRRSP